MIEVQHLTRTRGRETVLGDVSFTVRNGTVCGLLGAADSGTSTLTQILAGVLAPTGGTVRIDGYDVVASSRQAKGRVGYLPQNAAAFPDMTPYEYLSFVAEARGAKDELGERQIKEALHLTGVTAPKDRLMMNLSPWDRCLVGVAQTLLGDPAPDTLILEDPFEGLTAGQSAALRTLLSSLKGRYTILLTATAPGEVASLCDTLFLLHEGGLTQLEGPALARLHAPDTVLTLTVKGDEAGVRAALLAVDGVQAVDVLEITTGAAFAYIDEAAEGEEAGGSPADTTLRLSVTTDGDRQVRDALFFALAADRYVLVSCDTATVSLSELAALVSGDTAADVAADTADEEVTD